jgi:hypothetical protein
VSKPVSVAYATTVNRIYSPTRTIVASKTKVAFPALPRLMFRYAPIPTLFFLGSAVFLSGVILGILPFGSDGFFAFGLILLLLMVLSGAR